MLNEWTQEFANAGPPSLSTSEKIEDAINKIKNYVFFKEPVGMFSGITVLCDSGFYAKLKKYSRHKEKRQWREVRNKFGQDKAKWKEMRGY